MTEPAQMGDQVVKARRQSPHATLANINPGEREAREFRNAQTHCCKWMYHPFRPYGMHVPEVKEWKEQLALHLQCDGVSRDATQSSW